jgi:hypothetical protein
MVVIYNNSLYKCIFYWMYKMAATWTNHRGRYFYSRCRNWVPAYGIL